VQGAFFQESPRISRISHRVPRNLPLNEKSRSQLVTAGRKGAFRGTTRVHGRRGPSVRSEPLTRETRRSAGGLWRLSFFAVSREEKISSPE